MKWKNKNLRYVAFFDILGFKDLVSRFDHDIILRKLNKLKTTTQKLENMKWGEEKIKKFKLTIHSYQTKSISFSDSILFFSNGDKMEDFIKILIDSYGLFRSAVKSGIAIKGAISFGEITVDFEKSLFFGQPIIDAFLLHEDLHMLGVILDHHAENKFCGYKNFNLINDSLTFQKVKMKQGSISHYILTVKTPEVISEMIADLKKLYKTTSGKSRKYIDNSIENYQSIS